jgi:hypothetical protein
MQLLAVLFATALSTTLLAGDTTALTPAEAIDRIGRPQVIVEMTVRSSKDRLAKRGIIYLDSEEDFADPKNLGVAISAEAAARFKKDGIDDPATHFKGKTLRVRGCVMRFEERPYLPVHSPKQIVVVDES